MRETDTVCLMEVFLLQVVTESPYYFCTDTILPEARAGQQLVNFICDKMQL